MGFLYFFGVMLVVYLVIFFIDYHFAKVKIAKYTSDRSIKVKSFLILFSDDGINPFLRKKWVFTPTVLINGRPGGRSYRYFLVDCENSDGKLTLYIEVERKTFGNRTIRIKEIM